MSSTKSSKARNTPSGAATAAVPAGFGDKIFLKFGRTGTRLIHRTLATVLLVLVLLADYLIVLFTAMNMVPNIAVLVQQATGVTLEARLDAVIAGWLLPVLFILAMVLVAEVFLLRRLWIAATGLIRRMGKALFRLDAGKQALPFPAKTPLKTSRQAADAA